MGMNSQKNFFLIWEGNSRLEKRDFLAKQLGGGLAVDFFWE